MPVTLATLPALETLNVTGKTVFCRLDLNVPLQAGKITSEARLRAALPSVQHLLAQGAKLALASHLGRPKQAAESPYSLAPVAQRLTTLLQHEVVLLQTCVGAPVRAALDKLRPGQLLLLENLRFHPGEEANDADFARQLAAGFQVYVNDAFGAAHRAHASIVGMLPYVPELAIGKLMQLEVGALSRLLEKPPQPFVAVVGGAKVADKLGVLSALLPHVRVLCIGGAMAYTFLHAQGLPVGRSPVDLQALPLARAVLQQATRQQVQIILPSDHRAASHFARDATPQLTHDFAHDAGHDVLLGLDIGPQSIARMTQALQQAATLFWNGPVGVFEWPAYAHGTQALAAAVAANTGFCVVGGGDSLAALEAAGVGASPTRHLSTGGGASLEFLQYGTLPGLQALTEQWRARQAAAVKRGSDASTPPR